MATLTVTVLPYEKSNGSRSVVIRLYHNLRLAYIKTKYSVLGIDVRDGKIMDDFLSDRLNMQVKKCRDEILKLEDSVYGYTASELAKHLEDVIKGNGARKRSGIDFLAFSHGHIETLRAQGRKGSADKLTTTVNHLDDFLNGRVTADDISLNMLRAFERYLCSERVIKRNNQGKIKEYKKPPLSPSALRTNMVNLQTLFNEAKLAYNDEDRGMVAIRHSPFFRYKFPIVPLTESKNIGVEGVRAIRDHPVRADPSVHPGRTVLGRDVFLLSFYLIGANPVDLYEARRGDYGKGRFSYKRTKTKGRRRDEAYISIRVPKEARALFEKYLDRGESSDRLFSFHERYTHCHAFNRAVNIGLKSLAKQIDCLPERLTLYYARHSWASIARNVCGISKDIVSMSLNHSERSVTDDYLERDFGVVDRANRKVLDSLK